MKRCAISLIGLMVPILFMAQTSDPNELVSLRITEPKFIPENGMQGAVEAESLQEGNIISYLAQQIEYPKDSERWLREGVVVVRFDVLPTGSLANFDVLNSVSDECDKAVIKALEKTDGMWVPGIKAGVPVIMQEQVKVRFAIVGSSGIKTAQHYSSKGHKFFIDGNYEKALSCFNKALLYAPEHSTTLYFRGLARYELNDLEGALADFNYVGELGSGLAAHIIPQVQHDLKYAVGKKQKKLN